MKDTIKNKKIVLIYLIIFLAVVFIIVGTIINAIKKYDVDGIEVTNKNGETIELNDFNKDFKVEKEIIVKNKTKESKEYNIEWVEVENTLKKQSYLTYVIKGKGEGAKNVGMSQAPVAPLQIVSDISIEAKKEQKYKIIITYTKKDVIEKNNKFYGKIKITSASKKIKK